MIDVKKAIFEDYKIDEKLFNIWLNNFKDDKNIKKNIQDLIEIDKKVFRKNS